jgi:hypothetical protein
VRSSLVYGRTLNPPRLVRHRHWSGHAQLSGTHRSRKLRRLIRAARAFRRRMPGRADHASDQGQLHHAFWRAVHLPRPGRRILRQDQPRTVLRNRWRGATRRCRASYLRAIESRSPWRADYSTDVARVVLLPSNELRIDEPSSANGHFASSDSNFHRIIRASVRECLETWRLQAQAGRVTVEALEAIVARAAVPILRQLEERARAGRGAAPEPRPHDAHGVPGSDGQAAGFTRAERRRSGLTC